MQEMNGYPTLDAALNNRYRGHVSRDWAEWREQYAVDDASLIAADSANAWIGRQKANYRGLAGHLSLRHLVASNVDQPFLEEIGKLERIERLELEWPMVAKDLAPLLNLGNLNFLSIDSPRNISDFAPLLTLPALRTLIITNAKKMKSLEWLADAHHLEVIGAEGGMWSPFRIETLEPLAGLRSLEAFLGVSTKLGDKKLMPLAQCPRLVFLSIACVAPEAEFERLKRAKPGLVCSWFDPAMWAALRR